MLANIVIAAAAITATLALLDWGLGDKDKQWLAEESVYLWSVLDDARRVSLIRLFKARVFQNIIFIISIIISITFWFFGIMIHIASDLSISVKHFYILIFITSPIFMVFMWKFISGPLSRYLSWTPGIFMYALRALILCAIFNLPFLVLIKVGFDPWNSIFGSILLTVLFFLYIISIFFLLLFVLSSSASVVIVFCSVLIRVSEFVMRRIAEYPKGPLLGLSALTGGFAALIKIFV